MWIASSTDKALTPSAIALGNFDGIHRGHLQVIEPAIAAARDFDLSGVVPTLVSFKPHPQEYFTGTRRQLLTPLEDKVARLEAVGIEQLVLLPFDAALAALSPQDFVVEMLVKRLRACFICVGENFRFGQGRSGRAVDLEAIAGSLAIPVEVVALKTEGGERISSSRIRQALAAGNIVEANRLLGYTYSLRGLVVAGEKLGRTIGFPTANLQISPDKLIPRQGVYYVRVSSASVLPPETPVDGVMNIGYRPTVDGRTLTVEVHLLDWSGDLYGQTMTVSLERYLRPEQQFSSLDALKAQIAADCEAARRMALLNSSLS